MKASGDKSTSVITVIALGLLLATTAKSEIKNFTFEGTISMVDDLGFMLDGSITNGASFEGFYTFDSTTTSSNPDPTVGDYRFTESTFGVVLKVGNYVFRTNPRHVDFLIEVVNRPGDDAYVIRSYNNVCSQPLLVEHIAWQLNDPTGTAVTNASLPLTPPTLSSWPSQFGFDVSGGGFLGYLLRGTVNSVSEAPAVIPDPPAVTLGDAVEVKWPSRLGYFYQIQVSHDLETWTNVGEPILGDGTALSRFFAREPGKTAYYRAEIANFEK